jgi:multidrug efflux pump subunit AcrA (membrane-fusion protein)
MNKQPKRTLIEGWVFLTLLAGVLVVYLNWTYARAESNQAHIIISNYEVGTNYAGLITQQYVQVGDTVRAGEPLFELKSDELTQQLGSGQVTANRFTP